MHRKYFAAALVLFLSASAATAQNNARRDRGYPPKLDGAKVETYKTIGDVKLGAYIFFPEGHKRTDNRPAVVFFFGGGWRGGSPAQFEEHCKYLASRGMVAITADYRVASRHNVKANACVADAKSAIRWVRTEAARLGVDPDRIVAAGGSAGGHLAACAGVVDGFDESKEDAQISSRPNAMALFNPALVLAPVEGRRQVDEQRVAAMRDRMGVDPKELSPYHQVKAGAPPAIVFHGKEDTTVPYRTAELFAKAMQDAGAQCKLLGYEGQAHGFFNFGRGDNSHYRKTLRSLDEFLVSLGYLQGEPTIAAE